MTQPDKSKLSPMMKQYFDIKEQYPDCILFFRLGDFYEMFYQDAHICSKELELTLTGKNCGQEERAPMCGVPFHSCEPYIHRLVEKGYKVAICEQTEDPALAKGIVKRDVIKIVTPGTLTSGTMLKEGENNYLASLFFKTMKEKSPTSGETILSLAYSDISTGELAVTETTGDSKGYEEIIDEICKLSPKEILVNQSFYDYFGIKELGDISGLSESGISILDDTNFSSDAAEKIMAGNLGKGSVIASGLKEREGALASLGALLSYLIETQKQSLKQITTCVYYEMGSRMSLDKATLRNLEITETLYDKKREGSLLGILDKTHTAMGARLLKKWLREPLNNPLEINSRLDAVEEMVNNPLLKNNITEQLKLIYDFERLSARVASGNANGRDLLAIKRSVNALPDIKESLGYSTLGDESLLEDLKNSIKDLSDVGELIEKAIDPDAPFTVKEGGIILPGYSTELDDLKESIKDAKAWIAGLENREKERTGIKNLKVGFNKVFGYYIDVTKSQIGLVPEDYIRKQTLVNNERYITPELKEMEGLVLNAETKINKLEYDLFTEIRESLEVRIKEFQETSHAIAILDCINSFATCALRYGYIKPTVDDSLVLEIDKGRHPVVEQTEGKGLFVSNDTYLDNKENVLAIITGPNMSGKSTYMRQTALIVLMAQAGSFVPADKARIGVCDRIFTRIGASDNLAQGQSTFYVEMSELSYILNTAKERSLIILDEIGRGTSTYDGLSIAWAAASFLCNSIRRIRTLFATHYHELTELSSMVDGIFDLNVDVAEENGEIVFLHKIVPGAASKSYGIHVARLAGVPKTILEDAERKLESMEENAGSKNLVSYTHKDKDNVLTENMSNSNQGEGGMEGTQLSLFTNLNESQLINRVKELDLMEVTPSEAIRILEELKDLIDD